MINDSPEQLSIDNLVVLASNPVSDGLSGQIDGQTYQDEHKGNTPRVKRVEHESQVLGETRGFVRTENLSIFS